VYVFSSKSPKSSLVYTINVTKDMGLRHGHDDPHDAIFTNEGHIVVGTYADGYVGYWKLSGPTSKPTSRPTPRPTPPGPPTPRPPSPRPPAPPPAAVPGGVQLLVIRLGPCGLLSVLFKESTTESLVLFLTCDQYKYELGRHHPTRSIYTFSSLNINIVLCDLCI